MSYVKVKSVNMRNIDNIEIIGASNNVRPLTFYKSFYRSNDNVSAISLFIRDLDGGCIKLYNTRANAKYLYALEETKKELPEYTALQYGISSLNMNGIEMKKVVEVFLKYLNFKDKNKYIIKFEGDFYLEKVIEDGFRYGFNVEDAKKISYHEASLLKDRFKKYNPCILKVV